MKTKILSAMLVLVFCMTLTLCACDKNESEKPTEKVATVDQTEAIDPLWEGATYLEDTTLGEGATSIDVKVEAGEKAVTLTINTDAKNLEDALLGVELVEGEQGAYGLYVKTVNGILADYDVDQSYWAMYKDGEYLTAGANETAISSGDKFELVYTK
ncbi:MAG: DUF4430 domain-containing protein [Ruminococcus sp.]|nr:DUF4430 domain-containing protein [Ruminococcus sp.]